MSIEELEKKLYQQSAKKQVVLEKENKTQKILPPSVSVEKEWLEEGSEERSEKRFAIISKFSRYGRILFWILLAVIVAAGGIAGFYFYKYYSSRDINLSIEAPKEALIGVPFDLAINFDNNSANILLDSKLSVNLPDNSILTGDDFNKRIITKDLGDLGVGTSLKEKFSVLILGEEQAVKRFNVSVSYSLKSTLGTRFEKTKSVEASVREPGIKLNLTTPQKVLNSEEFEMEIHYQNVAEIDFSDIELELVFPSNFTFKKSSITPSVGNRIWQLGDLAKGTEGSFTITGSVVGQEMSFFEIRSILRVPFLGRKYSIGEKSATLSIASSPLSLAIKVNEQDNYLASLGDSLKYIISYRNNTDVGLSDIIVKAQLISEMFDFSTLGTQAFFSSLDNTLTWNTANSPALRILEAGAAGNLEFQIKLKSNYPTKRLSDKNFVLKIRTEINSPTVPYYVASERTVGLANFETKVVGGITADAKAFFREPDWGISNKGNWPPKVNKPTNFTIHWVITNYATDVREVEVKAFLQSGVRWTGEVKSNIGTQPEYNERTQEIIWKIDRISANKGVIGKPTEAVFQIEATPDITQANNYMPLMSQTSIKAFDEFVNVELNNSDEPLTTGLTDDSTVDPRDGTVLP